MDRLGDEEVPEALRGVLRSPGQLGSRLELIQETVIRRVAVIQPRRFEEPAPVSPRPEGVDVIGEDLVD
jgi:hypothetical protein